MPDSEPQPAGPGCLLFLSIVGALILFFLGLPSIALYIASFFGYGETHALNVYKMVFYFVGIPALTVGGIFLWTGIRGLRRRPSAPLPDPE